ncbi:hypothetical protein DID88_010461 [Monilinia fructigena]|uniref:Acylphosphatase n=1 Tax=Monilinia fructigena TaxID=38457 RepID=A0A395IL78_9HELO|nr:hypothetical protein DID88_010461 [Monilinia fructigena]
MTKRIGFTVSGRVQGVSFRYFTQKKAKSYGIIGWVRNRDDGKVEGEAQGPSSEIEKLVGDLKKGPQHAHVTDYEERDLDVKSDGEKEKNFDVVR